MAGSQAKDIDMRNKISPLGPTIATAVPFPVAPSQTTFMNGSQHSSRPEVPPDSYDDSVPTIDRDSIDHTSRQYASITAHDTPKALGSTRDFPKGESVKVQGKSIMTTMGRAIRSRANWVDKSLSSKLGLNEGFLNRWVKNKIGVTLYNIVATEDPDALEEKRWIIIPEEPALESELYEPFTHLITTALKALLKHGDEREVVDTHNKHFLHFEEHHTSPDIVVRGTGPSFEIPSNGQPVGYSNIVTFFEIKLDSEIGRDENINQLVVYARQVFIHQPNRMFVRGLLLSQKRVQLVHFDHAGIQRTPFYNIHDEPAAFLGMLTALTTTSDDRRYLGLDDSLRWKLDSQGRKISGTLRTLALDRARRLHLVLIGPISHHRHIRGSGTIYWNAYDPEAKTYTEYLIKDSWSSAGRTPEWELLSRVNEKGIKGVAVMVWHEECIADVSMFRCVKTAGFYFNRTLSRIVMVTYGRDIENFKSLIQLLRALRDALAAHGNLYGAGILHRDISNKTILLGREDAKVGDQGILIDLSAAFDYYSGGNSLINKEPLMTSRFFQSCGILDFLIDLNNDDAQALAPAHDYLDDLESFFFVLCYLLFGFEPNGDPRALTDKARSVIEDWDSERPGRALAGKNMLLSAARRQRDLAIAVVGNSWGEPCKRLFEEFLNWVIGIQAEKGRLRREKYPEFLRQRDELIKQERGEPAKSETGAVPKGNTKDSVYLKSIYASLYLKAQQHYDQLLEIFRKAIIAVETSPTDGEDTPKVSIPNPDPTIRTDASLATGSAQTNTGPIPLHLQDSQKRRRFSSVTGRDQKFKVPEAPPPKASRHDENGNGAAWMLRDSGS